MPAIRLFGQRRVGLGAEAADLDIEFCDLGVEDLVPAG